MIIYLQMIDSPEDQSKFVKLYEEYRGLMYHVAYGILRNEHDAEDAVHQAFLKVAETIENVDGTICPRTKGYFVTIVENKSIDIYRHKQRYQMVELNNENMGVIIEYDGGNALAKCITQLPAKYREVLLLKHFHGYSSKEVAKIMKLSEANVIKIDQRAKNKLRVLCEEEGLL